ncbi:jg11074 [Pararge aegeria aegeria]|uniref:Jg11074 protein n=1 Tax=Pararge aegeria aegeria TaxID=348720 RepID=A0A8S4R645_9NEOP|nr:jg11074 [Pararge aegeria aegeria]
MLFSISPCVARDRSSDRTDGAWRGSGGASRRAPKDAAPIDPYLGAVTEKNKFSKMSKYSKLSYAYLSAVWGRRIRIPLSPPLSGVVRGD